MCTATVLKRNGSLFLVQDLGSGLGNIRRLSEEQESRYFSRSRSVLSLKPLILGGVMAEQGL